MEILKMILLLLCAMILTSCASLKPGETRFWLVGEGVATKRVGESSEATLERAKNKAKMDVALRFNNSVAARKNLAELLPDWAPTILDPTEPLPLPIRKNLFVKKWEEIIVLREPGIVAWAVLPLKAPSPLTSSSLSILFPGLGQLYNRSPSFGYLLLGGISAGLGAYSYLMYNDWNSKYKGETRYEYMIDYYDEKNKWFKITQGALGIHAIIVVYSAIEAFTTARTLQDALRDIQTSGPFTPSSSINPLHFKLSPTIRGIELTFSYELSHANK